MEDKVNDYLDLPRLRQIVAVFGGSRDNTQQTLELADRLGRAISSRNWIILTGGTGPADSPVKNRAIQAAIRGDSKSWVGVNRVKGETATGTPVKGGFAIESTLNHQRNYLEACMTDAAICLEGNAGTMSELASCLLLRRPVALVGDRWRTECDLDGNKSGALTTLIKATIDTFKVTGAHTLEPHQVGEAAIRDGLRNVFSPYAYFSADASEDDILAWILSKLPPSGPFPGSFPQNVAGHVDVELKYSAWLNVAGRG